MKKASLLVLSAILVLLVGIRIGAGLARNADQDNWDVAIQALKLCKKHLNDEGLDFGSAAQEQKDDTPEFDIDPANSVSI